MFLELRVVGFVLFWFVFSSFYLALFPKISTENERLFLKEFMSLTDFTPPSGKIKLFLVN